MPQTNKKQIFFIVSPVPINTIVEIVLYLIIEYRTSVIACFLSKKTGKVLKASYKLGLWNPNFFIPLFISGQLINKFHNKPLR